MKFEPDPKIDIGESEKVTLGGQDWYVPKLALRQIKRIAPLIPDIIALLDRINAAAEAARADANAAPFALRADEIETVIAAVHIGLTRAYPHLTRDAFEDLPIPLGELITALRVVALQSRAIVPKQGDELGKAQAAA